MYAVSLCVGLHLSINNLCIQRWHAAA